MRWLLVLGVVLSVRGVASADGAAFETRAFADLEVTIELAAEVPGYQFYVLPMTRPLGSPDRPLLLLRTGAPVTVSGRDDPPRKQKEVLVAAIPTAVMAKLHGNPPTEDWLVKLWATEHRNGPIRFSVPLSLKRLTATYNPRWVIAVRYRAELEPGGTVIRLTELENDEHKWWRGRGIMFLAGCLVCLAAVVFGRWLVRRAAARRSHPAA
jgi:hypothetical protein